MRFSTIEAINKLLLDEIVKAQREYDEANAAAKAYCEKVKAALGDTVNKCELEKILYQSEQSKRAKSAQLHVIELERVRDDFIDTDWR